MIQKVTDRVSYVGVKNPELRVFDVIMHTKYGTSYNAYVIKGDDKVALVEVVKEQYTDQYLDMVREIVDLSEVDYIVLDHTEPDHSGALEHVVRLAPQAKVVGTRAAINFLPEITNLDLDTMVVKDGDKLDLGGVTLEFIMAPYLHWPDTMFTYIPEERMLISGDMFGCHYAPEGIFDEDFNEDLIDAQKYYFDVIISPFKDYAMKAIKRVESMDVSIIGPSHGPVLVHQPKDAVARFKDWASDILKTNDPKRVVIAYVSAYGYTKELADVAAKAVEDAGLHVELCEITDTGLKELVPKIDAADALMVGSPTFNRDALPPVWELLTYLSAFKNKGKPATAFGSYGWSGEAPKMLMTRMKSLGMKLPIEEGFKTRFKPSEQAKVDMAAYAKEFAEAVKG